MRRIIALFILGSMIFNFTTISSYSQDNGKEEMRAAWIASVYNQDWPNKSNKNNEESQKAQYKSILDDLESLGFNSVVVQIRPKGDALYKSDLNPWSDVLTGIQGKDPGYDPLEFMIEETHKRGMEFHAWFNPYRITTTGTDLSKLSNDNYARLNPDTVMEHTWTSNNNTYSALCYNPGIPKVREYIVDTVSEVVKNYDIDAVHFDDYFYPSGNYDDDTAYNTYGNGMNKDDWRRSNVDKLVNEVNQAIKNINPKVEFGISPRGIWKNKSSDSTGSDTNGAESYYDIYCDTRTWIKNGWIDYVVPQLYWKIGQKNADYSKLVKWWANEVKNTNTTLYIGQGIYKDEVAKEIEDQVNINRKINDIKGSMYFSYRDIKSNRQNIRQSLNNLYNKVEEILPEIPILSDGVNYQTHIQDIGWQEWKSNEETSGTEGLGKRLEAISIKLNNILPQSTIKYQTHIQDIGWQEWKKDGDISGTEGLGKRLEAIRIKLENSPGYHIEYRTHIQDIGWQEWKKDGDISGTEGLGKRLEAIQINLAKAPENLDISYQTHIQDIGWQEWKKNSEMSGTENLGMRLEAIKIKLDNNIKEYNIKYRVHIQDIGWQEWKYNGQLAGTVNLGKRIEAIEIQITE